MAKFTLLFSLLFLKTTTAYSAVPEDSSPLSFIKSSCSITLYPVLCVKSLSTYATTIQQSPEQMAQAALSVSLSVARTSKSFVIQMSKSKGSKAWEHNVLRDCIDEMGDSIDRLSNSISELGHMNGGNADDFLWHMSNVQTWVSAALTDENTCMDGFSERAMTGKLKNAVRDQITQVAQVTSNALALINRLAERH